MSIDNISNVGTIIDDSNEKVEIFLSCRNLKNMDVFSLTDPQIKLYLERKGEYHYFDQTEIIWDNLNPNFTKTFIVDYIFEVKQGIKFEIFDIDGPNKSELAGVVETTIGEIVGAKNMTSTYDIARKGKVNGKLIVRCEKVQQNLSVAKFQISADHLKNTRGFFKKLIGKKSNPILKLARAAGDSGFVAIYDSERIKNTLTPHWEPFEIKVRKLCNGDYHRPIKAQVISRMRFKEKLIGECQFTLDELISQERREFALNNPAKDKTQGHLTFDRFNLVEKPSFLDYLKGGTELAVMCAIDFTSSNGDPNSPESLHAVKFDNRLNAYQSAIKGCCDILLNYDFDKKIPMYGFGGKPKFPNLSTQSVSHCFSLTGNAQDPWAYGLDGIMDVYKNALNNVELSGPTLFSPMLQEAMKVAFQNKADGSKEYTILLIITDGEIHDMEQTINCLIKSAQLPLSVIIVGVGNTDFSNMVILDGDDGLWNADGVKAERDLVQFVPFRDFNDSPEMLAKNVLEEIPDQLVEYMTSVGVKPNPPQDHRVLNRGDTMNNSVSMNNSVQINAVNNTNPINPNQINVNYNSGNGGMNDQQKQQQWQHQGLYPNMNRGFN